MIYFNNELGSKDAPTRPFSFTYLLNFGTKEQTSVGTFAFDANMVKNKIKVQDF